MVLMMLLYLERIQKITKTIRNNLEKYLSNIIFWSFKNIINKFKFKDLQDCSKLMKNKLKMKFVKWSTIKWSFAKSTELNLSLHLSLNKVKMKYSINGILILSRYSFCWIKQAIWLKEKRKNIFEWIKNRN